MTLVTVKRRKSLKLKQSDIVESVKSGATAGAHHFRRNMLMLRFTRRGATLLGFKPRSGTAGSGKAFQGSYTWKKLKRRENGEGVRAIGETKPNVWSGRARSSAKSRSRVEVKRRNKTGGELIVDGRIVFPAPQLNFRNASTGTHPSEEMKRVHPSEVNEIARVSGKATDVALNRRIKRRK